jgi:zinc transport system substrate-binding protein
MLLFCAVASSQEQVKTFAAIAPVAYFAERVGAEHVSVGVLVGPGQDPHTYEPSPRMLAELSAASLYFYVGLPFEQRLIDKLKSINPGLRVVDVREGIQLRPTEPGEEEHGHGAGAPDPHVWLSPLNAKIIATNIERALESGDAAHAAGYRNNLQALLKELDELNARLTAELAPFRGRAFYAYHPAFGYFADAYGLNQVPVEVSGKEPTAKQLVQLIDQARARNIKAVFVQRQFSTKSAESLAREIGGTVIEIDPLAKDYTGNLEEIAQRLRQAFLSS